MMFDLNHLPTLEATYTCFSRNHLGEFKSRKNHRPHKKSRNLTLHKTNISLKRERENHLQGGTSGRGYVSSEGTCDMGAQNGCIFYK